jgi:hypothetical protein
MASYRELLSCIREGLSAREIMAELELPPNKLRRMLNASHLATELEVEEELAGRLVLHRAAMDVSVLVDRLRELAMEGTGETARKACLALLGEGMRLVHARQAAMVVAEMEEGSGLLTPVGC